MSEAGEMAFMPGELAACGVPASVLPYEGNTRAYWVVKGGFDLFFRFPAPNNVLQALHPVCRIGAGGLFVAGSLPLALADCQARFVPLPDTVVVALDELTEKACKMGDKELEAACSRWIGALVREADCGLVPAHYRFLGPDAPIDLAHDEVCAFAVAMGWVRVVAGRVALMGDDSLCFGHGETICLHPDSWVVACGEASLEPLDFAACLRNGQVLPALMAVQAAMLIRFVGRITENEQRFGDRLAMRRATSTNLMSGALRRFAGLLHPEFAESEKLAADDPVLGACRAVGRELGITFPGMPRGSAQLSPIERMRAAADSVHVQKRRVALLGSWWEEDAGPMVAFTEAAGSPVALLRGQSKGYVALDPVTNLRVPVDRALAATLSPFAYSLFRSLPPGKLTLTDLLRLGLANQRRELSMILVTGGLLGLVGLLSPIALGYLFDHVIPDANRTQLAQIMAVLLGAAVATFFFTLARMEILLRLEGRVEATLQAAVWDRVLKLPVGFFRNYSAGDLALRINSVNDIHQQLSGTTLGGLLSALFSFLNFGLLFYYSPVLALLALGIVLVVVIVNSAAGLLILHNDRRIAEIQGNISGQVLQYLTGIAKLRVAAAEHRAFARWAACYAEFKSVGMRAQYIHNISEIFLSAFYVLASATLFYAVGVRLHNPVTVGGFSPEQFSTGSFVAFISAFTGFFLHFIEFGNTLLGLLHIIPQVERAKPILEALPEVDPMRTYPGELRGDINVAHLVFRYRTEGPPILDNVSFTARSGEFIAIIGPSGSGKSTLLRLLLGFERPESGSVYYDGKDMADLDIRAVRGQLGVVLQSSQLMPGDIHSNIVGVHALSVDDAWEAARLCGLDKDIEAMPMGMHTVLSEGASTLSGGQRQRILIARAIVRRPRILLFDEATSALDNRTQAIVSRSIERLKATRIVIAHRLSTILHADQILVMDKGRIVQSGTYAELIAQPGLFQELAERQLVR